MSRARGLVAALALGLAAAAAAQTSPDLPAGDGTVVGRLVHAQRPEAAADLEVILYALSADGGAGLRRTTSDAEGGFRFEGVSTDPAVVYLLGARAADIPFGQRFQFVPGERERRVTLELADPTSDPAAAEAQGVAIRLERGCTHLRVEHSHAMRNGSDRVILVPEDQRAGAEPLFEVEIPAEAEGFSSALGSGGLERSGGSVRFWGPLYPGEQELDFGWSQPLDAGGLELGFPRGADALRVLAPGEGLTIEAGGLRAAAPGAPHALWLAEDLEPGARVALEVAAPPRTDSQLRTTRAEIWLELDDVVLDVSERVEVQTAGGAGRADVPLLCLSLPAGASDLRLSDAALAAGLRGDPSGELALLGPLPPGPTQLALSYRLPAARGATRFARRFDRALPLLSVLVADTGIAAETDRLHRRRPVRAEDRIYLHWEAFAVEDGETVELSLRPLPARGGSGWGATSFAVLAGLASLGFLVAPLRDAPLRADPEEEEDADALERSAVARALADLDEDLETGKLDAEGHAELRRELEARAEALRARPAAKAPAALPDRCPACGQPTRPADRFCSQCGAALAAPSEA